MKRWLILSVAIFMIAGAGALLAYETTREERVFIAGNRPVTEDQVRETLQSQDWSDVEIRRSGDLLQAKGVKDGRARDITIDARTGRLREDDDDDD